MREEPSNTNNIRVCYACGNDTTYWNKKQHYYQWYSNLPIGWLCKDCHNRYINHPLSNPCRIVFKNKRVYLDKPPRKGVCMWCGAIIGSINELTEKHYKITQIHHKSYHEEDPLEDTVELCVPCHDATKKRSMYGNFVKE